MAKHHIVWLQHTRTGRPAMRVCRGERTVIISSSKDGHLPRRRRVRLTRYCVLARLGKSANYPSFRPLMDPKNAERLLLLLHKRFLPGHNFSSPAVRVGTTYTTYNTASPPRAMNIYDVYVGLSGII